jgi:hypothetical protein
VSAADAQLLLGGLRRIGSGMSNVPLGSGGPLKPGQGKNSPVEIMEGLVETGLLQSYSPESHCYVKCGNVQGVFSLASGSILCLCNECSGNDPCWFAPAAFERHGGMAASKKWRGSIQVGGAPHAGERGDAAKVCVLFIPHVRGLLCTPLSHVQGQCLTVLPCTCCKRQCPAMHVVVGATHSTHPWVASCLICAGERSEQPQDPGSVAG